MKQDNQYANPFQLTKSTDMTDQEIDKLWVDNTTSYSRDLASPDTIIIKSGKGSGKTHLLRYNSFELQNIRADRLQITPAEMIISDGYIGLYVLCGALHAERFSKKQHTAEVWNNLFQYAFELMLGLEILDRLSMILPNDQVREEAFSSAIYKLFDELECPPFTSISDADEYIDSVRRKLDLAINNSAYGKSLQDNPNAQIRVTRGTLIFGLPELFHKFYPEFNGVSFIFFLDEYENFNIDQQRYVNTLLREKRSPVSFKIGVRKYGIRTLDTLGPDPLVEGAEYRLLSLDYELREKHKLYKKFIGELLYTRLCAIVPDLKIKEVSKWADNAFETFDIAWRSPDIKKLVTNNHQAFLDYNAKFRKDLSLLTNLNEPSLNEIISALAQVEYPLLERANHLAFYKCLKPNVNLIEKAKEIQTGCIQFIGSKIKDNDYATNWEHWQQNLVHQLMRDYGQEPPYHGLNNLISMSEGMPRNFLYILYQMYDWALFKGRKLDYNNLFFSANLQQKGVKKASEWFYRDMKLSGRSGELVQTSIDRLAQLFKINHYGEKPTECSLISFSVDMDNITEQARNTINNATERSWLIQDNERKDRNQGNITGNFRLNKLLCPRYSLPISSRGTTELSIEDANCIFSRYEGNDSDYKALVEKWRDKVRPRALKKQHDPIQENLF